MKSFCKISAILLTLCLVFNACDIFAANGSSKAQDKQTRDLQSFTSINNASSVDVVYSQSDNFSVVVEGDAEYIDKVITRVSGSELYITLERGKYFNMHMRVIVSCPKIFALSMTGSGSIVCNTDITSDQPLVMRVTGSGDLKAKNVECAKSDVAVTGSGDLYVDHLNCASSDISVNGSGDIAIKKLESVTANIGIRGSGDVAIEDSYIIGGLAAKIQGSGDIHMNGRAKEIAATIMGSGDINGKMKYEKITRKRNGSGSIGF